MHTNKHTESNLIRNQRKELTEFLIYKKLAAITKDRIKKNILLEISKAELNHAAELEKYTKRKVNPYKFSILKIIVLSRIFGLTFALKLMEVREISAKEEYKGLDIDDKRKEKIIREEDEHELKLISMLDEDHLKYISSMVLGLNDALVEMTGALAGFSLALKNSNMIALVGLITGLSATLSMASSEYLSQRAEQNSRSPLKASIYTGMAYLLTVIALTIPFIIMSNYMLAIISTLVISFLIIYFFNFFISITQGLPFRKTFLEMAILSFGVAFVSFIIGYILRIFFNIDM